MTVRASKPGYQDGSTSVTLNGDRTGVSVGLRPTFQTINETPAGSVIGGSPACPAPTAAPCHVYLFHTNNGGAFSATLTWFGSENLDLELVRGTTSIAKSSGATNSETVSANLSPEVYELRIIYNGNAPIVNFTLNISRPN